MQASLRQQSDHAMLISWSDPTRGHFGDQRWTSARSRCSGLCILTGSIIRRGDPVYKRQRRDASRKITGIEMILAVALERVAV
ncbi:hypothetical protein A6V37_05925 [Paraburkholderia ginsengiterrae]|uniref:DUF3331 domain-containing protein n=1 Tax=Paraburkholderia ginsengiterrae TaxID=1462993 RepID=A0A1A9N3R3_9BURK|nr:hypothetical protein A6V37_05925 [Paraburkholderia ginsengiterrae]